MKMKNKKSTTKKEAKSNCDDDLSFCGIKSDINEEEVISKCIEKDASSLENKAALKDLDFCGVKSAEGKTKMRSKYNIKKQAITHSLTVKENKRRKKLLKRKLELKKELIAKKKEIKPKQSKKKTDIEEIKLNKMIRDYTSETVVPIRKKWYED